MLAKTLSDQLVALFLLHPVGYFAASRTDPGVVVLGHLQVFGVIIIRKEDTKKKLFQQHQQGLS